jgi:hypothetical protein
MEPDAPVSPHEKYIARSRIYHGSKSTHLMSSLDRELRLRELRAMRCKLVATLRMLYPTMARTRTGVSAALLFFPGATMMSEPVSGSAASRADPSIT